MTTLEDLMYLHGKSQGHDIPKANLEGSVAIEDPGFKPDDESEHISVCILKNGCSTRFAADTLAKFLKIHTCEVNFAGQRSEYTITKQWPYAHMPGNAMPDLSKFEFESCKMLEYACHKRKLRLGALKGNEFALVLHEVSQRGNVEACLQAISEHGVPNYFGAQRFDVGDSNLQGMPHRAQNDIPVHDRNKRNFWSSATRSALLNQVVDEHLKRIDFN